MTQTIDFYFDFSSPYAYFGSLFIEDMGVETRWRPYLMGAAMKETGVPALVEIPIKRDYAFHDVKRMARMYGVDFWIPDYFPFMSVKVCRAFYAIEQLQGPAPAKTFAAKAMAAVWTKGGANMSDAAAIIDLAGGGGIGEAMNEQEIKDRLRTETQGAIDRGCWGSPHFFINDAKTSEHFWGCDKRPQMEQWLEGSW